MEGKKNNKLKVYLFKNNISYRDLNRITGVSINTLTKLINTGNGTKSTKTLIALALKLNEDKIKKSVDFIDNLLPQ
jgi:DNA-binding Xre family transcriptional regulator